VTSHRGSVGRLLGPVQTVSLVVTLFGGAGCRGRDAEKPVTVGAASGELTAAQVTAARNAGLLPNTPLTPDLIYGSSSLPDSQAYGINNAGQVVGFFHDGGWPFVYGQPAVPFIYSGPTSPPGSPPPTLALLGPSGTGYPSCINDAGYVAGIAGPTAEDWSHAVLWHPDHSVETLPISSLSHATIVTNGRGIDGGVGHWLFEGTGADEMGANHLVAQIGRTWVPGHDGGQAIHLDGSTTQEYAEATASNDVAANGFTITTWIKPTGCQTPTASLFQRGRQFALGLKCGANGKSALTGYVNLTGAVTTMNDATGTFGAIDSGQWTHVAMTWDKHMVRYFVRGIEVGSQPADGNLVGLAYWLLIGYDDYAGVPAYYAGDMDDTALFKRVLSPAEIQTVMNGGAPVVDDPGRGQIVGGDIFANLGTLERWHFEGDAHDDLGDVSLLSWGSQPTFVQGRAGGLAMHFDGALGEYAPASGADEVATGDGFTIMGWIKPTGCQSPAVPLLERSPQFGFGLTCGPDGTSALTGFVNVTSGPFMQITTAAGAFGSIPSGAWTHVAMTWDKQVIRYYANGTFVGSTPVEGVIGGWAPWLLVGGDSTFYAGDIDDLALLNYPIARDQVRQYMDGTTAHRAPASGWFWYLYRKGDASSPKIRVIDAPNEPGIGNLGSIYGLNDLGEAVGPYGAPDWSSTAGALYTEGGGVRMLDDLVRPSPSDWVLQFPTAINNAHQIIGFGMHGSQPAGFRMDLATGAVTDLGRLEAPYDTPAIPRAINSAGHIVGTISDPGWPVRAFIYTDESGITDLNTLIDPALGWTLRDARAINDSDEVVGFAQNASGDWSAYKLSLVPLPPTSQVVCHGDVSGDQICLFSDGIVEISQGHFVAVFGFDNPSSTTIQPTSNVVSLGPPLTPVPNPKPAPPPNLAPGTHHGAFLPTFNSGETVAWTVNGATVTADASLSTRRLPTVRIGEHGLGVVIAGETIIIIPDEDPCDAELDCSNHGSCVRGTPPGQVSCACFAGYSGPDCSVADAPALVGALNGTFSVGDDGRASYSVPLRVPVGIAGLEPQIGLAYGSSIGNGPVGAGWSIDGLSAISRCAETSGQHGTAAPFDDVASDRFCWDGRLLVGIAGSYGQDGAEYRTEIETFASITSHGDPGSGTSYVGPSTFEIRTAAGEILTFGEGTALVKKGSVNRVWALSTIKDRSGNTISVSYVGPDCTGASCVNTRLAPATIQYADRQINFRYGTRGDTTTAYSRGLAEVARKRLTRVEMVVGSTIQWSYRLQYTEYLGLSHLDRLSECAGDGFLHCKPATQFTYERPPATGVPTPISSTVGLTFGTGPYAPKLGQTIVLDHDGDGRDDVLFPRLFGEVPGPGQTAFTYHILYGQASATNPLGNELDTGWISGRGGPALDIVFSQGNVFDFNHDGRDDILNSTLDGPLSGDLTHKTWTIYVAKAPGTGVPNVFGFDKVELNFIPHDLSTSRKIAGDSIYAADLDGDGFTDILSCESVMPPTIDLADNMKWYRSLGPGNGFAPPVTLPEIGDTCHTAPFFVDVDGDGVVDVLRPERNIFWDFLKGIPAPIGQMPWKALVKIARQPTWIDSGMTTNIVETPFEDDTSWFPSDPHAVSAFAAAYQTKAMDYNGDGLLDILQFSLLEPQDRIVLWINTGRGFERAPGGVAMADTSDSNYAFYRAQIVDWNHDGLQDILMPQGDPYDEAAISWIVYIALDAASSFYTGSPFLAVPVTMNSRQIGAFDVPVVMDHDGDGDREIVLASDNGDVASNAPHSLAILELNTATANLLTEVLDGSGQRDTVIYGGTHVDGEVYASNGACPSVVNCLRRVAPVVATSRKSITGGAVRETNYLYRDGRIGLFQRGWLGFSNVTKVVHDDRSGSSIPVLTVSDSFDNSTFVQAVAGTDVQRLYPFVGEATGRVTSHAPLSGLTGSGAAIFRADYADLTDKVIQVSHDGRPFSVQRTTVSQIRDSMPAEVVRLENRTTVAVDDYGNTTSVVMSTKNGAGEVVSTRTTTESHDVTPAKRAAWLIRLPDSRQISAVTDENNVTKEETYTYFPNGLLETATLSPNGGADSKLTSSFDYYSNGTLRTSTKVDLGGVQRADNFFYDSRGLLTAHVDAVGHQWTYVSDPARGTMLRETDPSGLVRGQTVDGFGRVTGLLGPDGVTTVTYSAPDASWGSSDGVLRATRTTPGGEQVAEVYDGLGRLVQLRASGMNGTNIFQETGYDWGDRAVAETRPHLFGDSSQGQIIYSYDSLGRMTQIMRPDEAATGGIATIDYTYEGADRNAAYATGWDTYAKKHAIDVVQQRAENGVLSKQATGAAGQVIISQDPGGALTHYRYGAFGLPTEIRDAHGNQTLTQYDQRGRRWQMSDPDRGLETVTYNAFGEVATITDAVGTITQIHDSIGRITDRIDAANNLTKWIYDGSKPSERGRLVEARTQMADGSVTTRTSYTYVPGGWYGQGLPSQIMRTIGSSTYTTTIDYDQFGRVHSLGYPTARGGGGEFSLTYAYDNGQVSSVTDTTTGQSYWAMLESDQGYRIRRELFGNGAQTVRTYKPLSGRPDVITTSLPINGTSTVVQSIGHTYDVRGNLLARTDMVVAAASRSYQFDQLDRLHIISGPSGQLDTIEYDDIGNITSRATIGTYRYEGTQPHAVTSAGSNIYEYDTRGGQSFRSGPLVTGGTQRIDYDPHGLPARVRGPGDIVEAAFTYDGDDRRVLLTTANGDSTYYVADLFEERRSGSHSDYRYHVFAGGREVAQVERSFDGAALGPRVVKYLHPDALGSTDVVSDEALAVRTVEYDSFGDVQSNSLETSGVTAGFTGQRHDSAIGLVDLKARLYDAKLGRFISPDPTISQPFYSQSLNRYTYALNNPLRFIDPRGLTTTDPTQPDPGEEEKKKKDPLDSKTAKDPTLRVDDYIQKGFVTTVDVEKNSVGREQAELPEARSEGGASEMDPDEFYGNRLPLPQPRSVLRPDPITIIGRVQREFGRPNGRIPIQDRRPPSPNNLVAVNKYGEPPGRRERVFMLHKDAAAAVRALRQRAADAGFNRELFTLKSAFRNQARQNELYRNAQNPGRGTAKLSEHITGRTMDFNLGIPNSLKAADEGRFDALKSYQWLRDNAADFGLNPYVAEPWHWSYNVVDE